MKISFCRNANQHFITRLIYDIDETMHN